MEQDNKNLEETKGETQNEEKSSQFEVSKVEIKNSEPAKDIVSKESAKKNDIESISSDNLDTNVDNNILRNIGITIQDKLKSQQTRLALQNQIEQDLVNLDKLVQYGMLDSKTGRILRKNILQKAFDNVVQAEKSKNIQQEKSNIFEEFNKTNKDFFKYDGRRDVLNYLQNEVAEIGLNDLSKISDIIQIVEQSAIKRYLANISHEKSLKDANEHAKQKLTANAQHSSEGTNLSQTFTRAQIAKMSRQEFEKYEKAIMKQLREGKFK